jgi:hypothetical protein
MSSSKQLFSDGEHISVDVPSAWRVAAASASIECQTSPELYQFEDAEVQTGPATNVMQAEVSSKFSGKTLLQFLAKTKKHATAEEWEERIVGGTITVDMELATDPEAVVEEDFFIEYVDYRKDAMVMSIYSALYLTYYYRLFVNIGYYIFTRCKRIPSRSARRRAGRGRGRGTAGCCPSCAAPRPPCPSSCGRTRPAGPSTGTICPRTSLPPRSSSGAPCPWTSSSGR